MGELHEIDPISLSALRRAPMEKIKASFYVSSALVDECRDAVAFLAGPPLHLSLSQLVEEALREKLARLKEEFSDGQPFPPHRGKVRAGRPIGRRSESE